MKWTNKQIDELSMVPNIFGIKYAGMGLFQIGEDDETGASVILHTGYGGVRDFLIAFEEHARESTMQPSSDQEGS